jgi:hypothetical protein
MLSLDYLLFIHVVVSVVVMHTWAYTKLATEQRAGLIEIGLALLYSFLPIVNVPWLFIFLYETFKREDV